MDGSLDTSLTGLTELRVHGVSGTPPDSMLNHPQPRLVAGDATAGFYRRWYPGGGGDDEAGVRHREAYSWGGLTSGAGARALWLLLLPFMLANVAHWMRPRPRSDPLGKLLSDLGDRLLRLFALLLTCTLLLGAAGPALDLTAWQCGGSPACLREHGWLTVLRSGPLSAPGRRVALLALVPAVLLGFVWWLGSRTWRDYEMVEFSGDSGESYAEKELRQPGFWHGAGPVGRLRSLHVTAGAALLGAVVAAPVVDRDGPLSVAGFLLLLHLGLLLAAAIAVLLQRIGDRGAETRDDQHGGHDRLLVGTRWVAILLLAAVLAVAAWPQAASWQSSGSLPGIEVALQIGFGMEFAVLLLFGATVALQKPWQTPEQAPGWRPAVGGFAAPIVATLAWLLVQAFVAGLYLRIADFLGRPYPSVDRAYAAAQRTAVAVASTSLPFTERLRAARLGAPLVVPADFYWAAAETMVFIAVAFVVGVSIWRTARRRTRSGYEAVCRDYPAASVAPGADLSLGAASSAERVVASAPDSEATTGDPTRDRWLWSIARARAMASLTDSAGGAVAIMLVSAFGLAVGGFTWHLVAPDLIISTPWSALSNAGTWAIAGLAGALIALGRTAYKSPAARRSLGVAWDLGSFWPRAAHPLAPPCYAERAVPELISRLTSLTTTASETGRPETGHVVLSSHSQGTILAAAAVLQLPAQVRERVGLMTYGSPLRRLYARYFPAYFGREDVREIGELLARRLSREDGGEHPMDEQDVAGVSSWRNLYRLTDPIGGWVLAEAQPATDLTGVVDQLLTDPGLDRRRGDASYPPIQAHSDYFDDPRYEQALSWVYQSILTIDVTDPVAPLPVDQPTRR